VIEADGYAFHGRQKSRWERDADCRTQLQALGWRVIVVTWERLRQAPDRVIAQIQDFLGIQRLPIAGRNLGPA
jgi:very-short-patch-repair endonuclease